MAPSVDRREFLELTSLASAGATLGLGAASRAEAGGAPAVRAQPGSPDVIVVGAGAFGAWTALALRERGATVTLIDAYGPANSRATSGDETRQIRLGYGDRALYSKWAQKAMEKWKARQAEFGRTLLLPTGRLQLAPDWTPGLRATQQIVSSLGAAIEPLGVDDLRKRFPQIDPQGVGVGLFEPGAGILRAREALLAATDAFVKKGGVFTIARATPGTPASGGLGGLSVGSGTMTASTYVFACGPWLKALFPTVVGPRLSTPRREVFFVGVPAGDTRFLHPNMPNYSEDSHYGFPSVDGRGVKVCPVGTELPQVNPDRDSRIVSAEMVADVYAYLARRFPALKDQPIVETRVCQLENTKDEHFFIDRHPDWRNVWIAGGGSGHGFKHGPNMGEFIADSVLGRPVDPEYAALFKWRPA
ncbi:MAG: FAD-dependent oxidoreductase [Vicinamibacterales bacterium]